MLFDDLQHIGIRACGTLRPNRKAIPSDLKQVGKLLPKGGIATWQRGELGCLAWHDRQVVYLLSNHTSVDTTVSFDQVRSDGTDVTVIKPKVVHDYNLHRGKVDTVDQLRGSYALERKSMKNWPSLAWWLIDMCMVNAFHLFSLQTHSTAAQLDFRIQLMHQLAAFTLPNASASSMEAHLTERGPVVFTTPSVWPSGATVRTAARVGSIAPSPTSPVITAMSICALILVSSSITMLSD